MKKTHGIEYLLARFIAWVFRILPRRAAIIFGARLGRAVNNIWTTRHNVVMNNLRTAFGESLSDAKREETTRSVFANIGMTMAEMCRFPKTSKDDILSMVTSEGERAFRQALDGGKGAILTGSHFGNWELMGAYINALGFPVDFLVRGQHNRKFDSFLTSLRESAGVRVIHSESGMKDVIRALHANRQVAIVSDQHAGSGGILIRFFGQLVSVPRAPAVLAVRTGAPIITGYIMRNTDFTHHCVFYPPEYPDLDADPDKEVLRLTRFFTNRIEEIIRMRPESWLWTHRRFKEVAGAEQKEGCIVE